MSTAESPLSGMAPVRCLVIAQARHGSDAACGLGRFGDAEFRCFCCAAWFPSSELQAAHALAAHDPVKRWCRRVNAR